MVRLLKKIIYIKCDDCGKKFNKQYAQYLEGPPWSTLVYKVCSKCYKNR